MHSKISTGSRSQSGSNLMMNLYTILLFMNTNIRFGALSTSHNNRLFWYLDYPGGIVCC